MYVFQQPVQQILYRTQNLFKPCFSVFSVSCCFPIAVYVCSRTLSFECEFTNLTLTHHFYYAFVSSERFIKQSSDQATSCYPARSHHEWMNESSAACWHAASPPSVLVVNGLEKAINDNPTWSLARCVNRSRWPLHCTAHSRLEDVGARILNRCQHRDSAIFYDSLFADWPLFTEYIVLLKCLLRITNDYYDVLMRMITTTVSVKYAVWQTTL